MSNKRFLSIGTVTKIEEITSADHIKEAGVMIFETQHPYYGYYGTTVPDDPNASSYFIAIRSQHSDEIIMRAIKMVNNTFPDKFDAVPGRLSFNNKSYGAIRVKCITDENIPSFIDALSGQGLEFIVSKKQTTVDALIHITKYFETEEVDDGIFIDLNNDSFAYLRVTKKPEWDKFVSITNHVRNNVEGIIFDAAQAIMYDKEGVIDLVRVYTERRSVENLKIIRNRYLETIK
ncbi:MAG: hypothetical protein QNK33_11110 [Bacteroidales bacterium]|nr:hypothetical protein [Bacteroidales bacterium]